MRVQGPSIKGHRRRSLATIAAAIGIVGVVSVSSATLAPSATSPVDVHDNPIAMSMVELLGDEDVSNPVTLAKLKADVLSGREGDGTGIDVALIDSGVAPVDGLDGPNVLHGPDLSGEGAFPQVAYLDSYGHGTHMAGIIAGQRAGERGLAPGARIVSVKVAGRDGVTSVGQVVAGIDWVVEHRNSDGLNIRVLNLSLGQSGVTSHEGDVLSAAVERAWNAGIFVVVAAGNGGANQDHLDSPANDPFPVSVGAVDSKTNRKSHYQTPAAWTANGDGTRNPDLMAPGVSIASYRVPGSTVDQQAPTARYGDNLFLGSGTSQSAAVVSAIAAVLFDDYPTMTPDELKETLTSASNSALNISETIIGQGVLSGARAWRYPEYGASPQNHATAAGAGTGIVAPTGATWSGGTWSGATWSGATWSGATWSGATWSGATWSGATWSGATWSGATWSGATWSGATWSGATWSGATWSGSGWS